MQELIGKEVELKTTDQKDRHWRARLEGIVVMGNSTFLSLSVPMNIHGTQMRSVFIGTNYVIWLRAAIGP